MNAGQLGILDRLDADGLDGAWVRYEVDAHASQIGLERVDAPADVDQRQPWLANRVVLEKPEVAANPIVPLSGLSVRLRQQAGISLDCYMGVIIQEQVESTLGGVLVTTNPMNGADFRNVYVNVSPRSVTEVVSGTQAPLQYLYNTVEGGGRTLSLGDAGSDVDGRAKEMLQRLALVGRLLQSHFAPDYTFATPVDIELAADGDRIHLLQLRPYAV